MKTVLKTTDEVRILNDDEIEQVNGGFMCWPAIVYMIARAFLAQL
jgi:hypothetical protein